MKRALDLVLSAIALVVASPVMLVVALAVRLDSRGGALFRQTRVGRGGREFAILKFRSMRPGDGPQVTAAGDPRITRLGAFLRSTKLDELPQLVNVLRGDMSLVGPRPEVPRYVAHWPKAEKAIVLSVRPGITDPAAVRFRREAELMAEAADPEGFYIQELIPEKLSLYVDYVQSRSTWGDVRILLSTFRATMVD